MQLPGITRITSRKMGGLDLPCSLRHDKSDVLLWRRNKIPESPFSRVMWLHDQVRIKIYTCFITSREQFFFLTLFINISQASEPGGPPVTDWKKPDMEVFTTNSSKFGWCNVDPDEAYAKRVKFKEECDCKYDGLWGRFCEIPVQTVCINQCSGHGHCRGGFCQATKFSF